VALLKIPRRKTAATTPEPVVLSKPGGKGKATPKRSAARASRPVTPYLKTSGAGGGRGGGGRRAAVGEQRAALRGEGPGPLPPRDRAPERGLARQVVDGRRNLTTLVFGLYLLIVGVQFAGRGALAQALFTLLLVLLLIVIADAVLLTRLVRREVRGAYPDSNVKTGFYSLQRALLPRRFRLPRPGVGVPG